MGDPRYMSITGLQPAIELRCDACGHGFTAVQATEVPSPALYICPRCRHYVVAPPEEDDEVWDLGGDDSDSLDSDSEDSGSDESDDGSERW